jgi:hypothetical protein
VGDGGRLVGAQRTPYVLADDAVYLRGLVVARDKAKGVAVYRTRGVPAVAQELLSVYDDGWSRPVFAFRRYACRGGSVRLTLESDPKLFKNGQRVAFLQAGKVVRLAYGEIRPVTVPLTRSCQMLAAVAPTVVPATAIRGSTDTRRLGVLVRKVEYLP